MVASRFMHRKGKSSSTRKRAARIHSLQRGVVLVTADAVASIGEEHATSQLRHPIALRHGPRNSVDERPRDSQPIELCIVIVDQDDLAEIFVRTLAEEVLTAGTGAP
jgi:hypothetical protein